MEDWHAQRIHPELLSHHIQYQAAGRSDHPRAGGAALSFHGRHRARPALHTAGHQWEADHVHLLVRYRSDLSHAEMLQQIKGRSSKWINETFRQFEHFSWQEGYGGFTVSKSQVPAVAAYIAGQKEHHQTQDFQSEFLELLLRHEIEFDENEVFR